jgi:hypothetical protein
VVGVKMGRQSGAGTAFTAVTGALFLIKKIKEVIIIEKE